MDESTQLGMLNILLEIKEDVSHFSSEVTNLRQQFNQFKIDYEFQKKEAFERFENRITKEINKIEANQKGLFDKLDVFDKELQILKHREDAQHAKQWKTVIAFFTSALGGAVISKFPDIIKLFLK